MSADNPIHAMAAAVAEEVTRALAKGTPIVPEWLSPQQVKAYCGISVPQLENYRRKGGGPPFSMRGDKTIRYSRADLDAWWRENLTTVRP